jgi:cytochrome c oxidase subunit 2
LAGLFGKDTPLASGGSVVADEAYLRESIINPQAKLVAGFGPIMPTFQGQVSEDQLVQLLAFIKSLQVSSGSGALPATAASPSPAAAPAQAPSPTRNIR